MEQEQDRYLSLREKLDRHYSWPSLYVFKFIVPAGKEGDLKRLFPQHTSSEKSSKNGNYTSITIHMMMPSSEAIIQVYRQAATIQGLIAL